MGAFLISYIVGSIVAIPFLVLHLLRTRRDLNALRAELAARGLIAPAEAATRGVVSAPIGAVRPLAQGAEAGQAPREQAAAPTVSRRDEA
jgi:hypothetical protein